MGFEITGLEELQAQLEGMGQTGTKISKTALKKGGEIIANEIKNNTPTSNIPRQNAKKGKLGKAPKTTWRTGQHLRDNIDKFSNVKVKNGKAYLDVGVEKGGRDKYFYSKFNEWGTSTQKGTHFVERSVKNTEQEVVAVISAEITREIESIWS